MKKGMIYLTFNALRVYAEPCGDVLYVETEIDPNAASAIFQKIWEYLDPDELRERVEAYFDPE